MKYRNAAAVLPQELLEELQKYVQGEALYIPKPPETHCRWGDRSGGRQLIADRNQQIRERFRGGDKIDHLADEFALSVESIRRIVYRKVVS